MNKDLSLQYVLPVYNESKTLTQTVTTLVDRIRNYRESKIFLIQNGSTDNSWQVCQDLQTKFPSFVEAKSISLKGLGFALYEGFRWASRSSLQDANCFIVFIGADMPFGFSDLDRIESYTSEGINEIDIFIGSKAHPNSILNVTYLRKCASRLFFLLRFVCLGMNIRDPQGSLFIRPHVIDQCLSRVRSRDFFFTTELIYFAKKDKFSHQELAIQMKPGCHRPTSVSILKDGFQVIKATVLLAFRC